VETIMSAAILVICYFLFNCQFFVVMMVRPGSAEATLKQSLSVARVRCFIQSRCPS